MARLRQSELGVRDVVVQMVPGDAAAQPTEQHAIHVRDIPTRPLVDCFVRRLPASTTDAGADDPLSLS